MALILRDRVQETGTANTTLSFTLTGAVAGFQSFSAIGNTNTTYYTATDTSNNWEAGLGTYSTTGPTLTRTTVLSSSNSGSAVTFSGSPATVNVFCTYPSSRALYLNDGSTGINVSQAAFTANGITYASSTSALATGSALTFNGTNLTTTGSAIAARFVPTSNTSAGGVTTSIWAFDSSTVAISPFNNPTYRLNTYGMSIGNATTPTATLHVDNPGGSNWTPSATSAVGIYYAGGTAPGNFYSAITQANSVSLRSTLFSYGDDIDNAPITTAVTLNIEGAPTGGTYSPITNSYALRIASGQSYFGDNIKVGSDASRSTTAGTNQIALFNGTAPVGTLTNGVSLYSSSGDLNFMDSAGAAYKVGFRNVPINSQTGNYPLVLEDSGKFIFKPSGSAATFTIPAVGSVNYDVGTVLTFVNMAGVTLTIAITTDTMYLAGTGTQGSRTLAQYGMATAIKMTTGVGTTTWLISGIGLT
jgi:hypothetical protein